MYYKKKEVKTLKQCIDELLKQYQLQPKLNEIDLQQNWVIIFGNSMKNHTKRIKLKKKVLIIYLDSSILRQELSYRKLQIIDNINEYFKFKLVEEVILK